MRILALLVFVAACATTPPPQRVAGCWIDRSVDGRTVTMRWLRDGAQPETLAGHLLEYGRNGTVQRRAEYRLERTGDDWRMCGGENGSSAPCYRVAEGGSGALGDGRVFIDAEEESLRIALLTRGGSETIFEGQRDGCD